MNIKENIEQTYKEILTNYIKHPNENSLYTGQKFSRQAIENKIPPEEIISLHRTVLQQAYPNLSKDIISSLDFLLEIMMGYGMAYQEHQSLRYIQQEIKSELEIAANVQHTLLETKVPQIPELDIGAISVPAKQMNGDYFHFVQDENGSISVAIADVIGKGMPAALCMSMIKYAMDSLPESRRNPFYVLENLNRVVEQNVDPSMFITMFYGMYDTDRHIFSYASAGHEPGFYYQSSKGEYIELDAKGLVLGVDKETRYRQYEKTIHVGDMIILLSDGVTECRTEEGFVEKETIVSYIKEYQNLPAQQMVENIYKDFEKLQDFQLRDDFTLIILKRRKQLFPK